MRATIAILLLIGVAQCMVYPVAQESASVMWQVPRVTEKPTFAPPEDSPTPHEFLMKALHKLAREVAAEEMRALMISAPDLNVPLNAFRWTFRDYAKLSNRIHRLINYQHRMTEEEYKTKKELDREHSPAEY